MALPRRLDLMQISSENRNFQLTVFVIKEQSIIKSKLSKRFIYTISCHAYSGIPSLSAPFEQHYRHKDVFENSFRKSCI